MFARGAVGEFFSRLLDGDPVAVGIAVGFGVLLLIAGVVIFITKRRLDADDERHRKRRGY
jgi:hypothetical protein